MKNSFLLIALLCCLTFFGQQKFVADAYGHVDDAAFTQLMQDRQYTLVGSYTTVSHNPDLQYAKVSRYGKWGFIDTKGNEVIKPQFAFVEDFNGGYARAGRYVFNEGTNYSDSNKYWLINLKGQKVSAEYDRINQPEKGFRIMLNDEKYGVLNAKGKEVLPAEYKGVTIDEKFFFVFDEQVAVFSHKGEQLTDFIYHRLDWWGAFLIEADRGFRLLHPDKFYPLNNEWYYDGEYKDYAELKWPDKKVIVVKSEGGYCLVDQKGTQVGGVYQHLAQRSAHYYEGINETGIWLINEKGKQVLKIKYQDSTAFSKNEDFFEVRNEVNTASTLYDSHFRKVDFSAYDYASIADKNLVIVQKADKCGLTDYKGRLVIPLQDIWLYGYNGWNISGQLRGSKDGFKQGILTTKGRVVIPLVYDDVYPQLGVYYVSKQGLYGLFDTKGRQLLDIAYHEIEPMVKPGYYKVMQNDKWGVVNNKFQITAPPQFNEIVAEYPDENLVLVSFNDGMSLFDYRGREVMQFDGEIIDLKCHYKGIIAYTKQDGKLYRTDLYGNEQPFDASGCE